MVGPSRIASVAGGLLVLAAWGLGQAGVLSGRLEVVAALADLLPVFVILLAWRFSRSRVLVASVALALAGWFLHGPLGTGGPSAEVGRGLLAVILPSNFALLALLRDRPLSRPEPLAHLGLLVAQVVATRLLLVHPRPGTWAEVWGRLLVAPQTALLAFLIAALLLGLGLAFRRGVTESSLLLVLAPCAMAVLGPGGAGRTVPLLAAGQLVLLVGLVEDSYRLAFHDELTGLPGRRALDEALRALSGRFTVAMVDVDHFKRFNDRFGHDAGDQVLRMVATELAAVGGGGRAFRYGGEEFAILFAGRELAEAGQALDTVRAAVEAREFALRSPQRPPKKPQRPRSTRMPRTVTVTVSGGVAAASGRRTDPEEVLRAADRALFRAKEAGRNRVVKG